MTATGSRVNCSSMFAPNVVSFIGGVCAKTSEANELSVGGSTVRRKKKSYQMI